MTTHLLKLRSRAGSSRKIAAAPHPLTLRQGAEQVAAALGTPVQAKLSLGAPDDTHEREADAVAERVMRMPEGEAPVPFSAGLVQRKCAQCEEEEAVQRKAAVEEGDEEEIEKKAAPGDSAGAGPVAADTAARIQSQRGSGEPLPAPEQAFFEARLGSDLSQVRIHSDVAAGEMNRQLHARAFTVGNDVFFAGGEYRPGTATGRRLMAHELAHVLEGGDGESTPMRRWEVGTVKPPPYDWSLVPAEQLPRLEQAHAIVEGVVGDTNCQNYFRDNCGSGGGTSLAQIFDRARIYLRDVDDNIFGQGELGGSNIAYNRRAYRIGKSMMASTLLHEMYHNCNPASTGQPGELSAENAVEACRLHTPWIDTVSPRRTTEGSRVTLRGWGFGPVRGASDSVEIGGVTASVISWDFMAGTSSRVEIVIEVPTGAGSGGVMVINNGVRSNSARLTVT